jgi:hypothetical protein
MQKGQPKRFSIKSMTYMCCAKNSNRINNLQCHTFLKKIEINQKKAPQAIKPEGPYSI